MHAVSRILTLYFAVEVTGKDWGEITLYSSSENVNK